MKTNTKNGFILAWIIILLALISFSSVILTSISQTMYLEADAAYLKACEQNLMASGLYWAKTNLEKDNRDIYNTEVQLDIEQMDILNSLLSVNIETTDDQTPSVQIKTTCSRGKFIYKTDSKYEIE